MFEIYKGKRIFITGHTGFKGSWLTAMLKKLGAEITGFSLPPATIPNHFNLLQTNCKNTLNNILHEKNLFLAIQEFQPEIIFHLAAQPLVRESYINPVNTYQTNVIGTLNILEAARQNKSVKAIVLITTDKVYENKEQQIAYTETDELGGYDMYSSSKACCEILIKSYRNSFFNKKFYKVNHNVLVASARAGNVIGGGDWSKDRLIPDIVRATSKKQKAQIRNPQSIRPWQHVLDCLCGYLKLGEKLLEEKKEYAEAWNFSPYKEDVKTVENIVTIAQKSWQDIDIEFGKPENNFHEAGLLILDNTKSVTKLGWEPIWDTHTAVEKTIEWYKAYYQNNQLLTSKNIDEYLNSLS